MKSFKILAIGLLMVSASTVFAADPEPKGWIETVKGWTYTPAKNAVVNEWSDNGYTGKAVVIAGAVLATYGLTKVSDTVKSVWNKTPLKHASDKVETTVQKAKDEPKSTEGAIVGVATAALIYAGLVKAGYVRNVLPSFGTTTPPGSPRKY